MTIRTGKNKSKLNGKVDILAKAMANVYQERVGNGTMSETEQWEEIAAEWQKTFGEQPPFGFEIGVDDIPLLRLCLKEKSQEPLDQHVRNLTKDGRIY